MDVLEITEDDNVTIEIEIDEMMKEFDGVIVKIKYKDEIIKELTVRESVECIESITMN